MTDEYILIRDIICDHSQRMLNIKKYYPYFKLTENAFSQFQGGKYSGLDMGYILMAVLRFFIEKNNFRESDVYYEEYEEFIKLVFRRDFEMPLDEEEEKEICDYIFDKITNGGRPFVYEYFDPADKTKKSIRMKLIDSRIRDGVIVYYITSDAIEFYLDTKEIKDESSISIAQVLLSKMITTKNYKGGIDVIKRINNEVGRLKIKKNEVLNMLSEDVFAGVKAYQEFVDTGIKWFEDEQKLFAKNMELIENTIGRVETDESYVSAIDDIYLLETELKKAIIKHSELLSACTDLQVRADEIISKAKFRRLRPGFDFSYALQKLMERERADLLYSLVSPLFGLNIRKNFNIVEVDKMLSLKKEKEDVAEKIKENKIEDDYVYEDELEENRISNNYEEFISTLLDGLLEKGHFGLEEFLDMLAKKYTDSILKNGDCFSFLVHMSQKQSYVVLDIIKKPDTFFESYLKSVAEKNPEKYEDIEFELSFDDKTPVKLGEHIEVAHIDFRLLSPMEAN